MYENQEYNKKILVNLVTAINDCINLLEEFHKISSTLKGVQEEIEYIIQQYETSPMVFKKKSKLIIADKDYKLTAVTKELVGNYYDNLVREIKPLLENGWRV